MDLAAERSMERFLVSPAVDFAHLRNPDRYKGPSKNYLAKSGDENLTRERSWYMSNGAGGSHGAKKAFSMLSAGGGESATRAIRWRRSRQRRGEDFRADIRR